MEKNEIIEKLCRLCGKVFKVDNLQLNEDMTAEDIPQWTSLTHMALVSEIEDCFEIKIKLKDLVAWKRVGDIVSTIDKRVNGN